MRYDTVCGFAVSGSLLLPVRGGRRDYAKKPAGRTYAWHCAAVCAGLCKPVKRRMQKAGDRGKLPAILPQQPDRTGIFTAFDQPKRAACLSGADKDGRRCKNMPSLDAGGVCSQACTAFVWTEKKDNDDTGGKQLMILTDIYIPAVDASYDFMLDENVPAIQVMEEISEMISKKVKEKKPEQITDFVLYAMDTGSLLDQNLSLYANGIHDGSRMIFV